MRVLIALALGIVIGIAGVWYFNKDKRREPQTAADQIKGTAQSAGAALEEKLRGFNLRTSDITNELARTGRVIREKASQAGQAISDATVDARTTGAIKTKFLREPGLSSWDITVDTTGGVVTLSGSVSSPEHIGKAMALALDTEGVRQVISTLQVKPRN